MFLRLTDLHCLFYEKYESNSIDNTKLGFSMFIDWITLKLTLVNDSIHINIFKNLHY